MSHRPIVLPSHGLSSRILVIKLGSLGDLFHALPAVHILKRQLAGVVDWVAQPEYVDLVKCFDDVDEIISFPRKTFFRDGLNCIRRVRSKSYDYVIDFQGLLKSAFITRCARTNKRIGPSYAREGSHYFYNAVTGPKNKNRHAVEETLDITKYFNLDTTPDSPITQKLLFPLTFPVKAMKIPSPSVAFVPCSRWLGKNWTPGHFIEVGRALQKQRSASIFLVGGPNDLTVCKKIERGLGKHTTNLCGKTTLVELGSLLQAMDLAVTVDSGPMHMAAAINTPVLAVFGITDPRRTGPYGAQHRVVKDDRITDDPSMSRVYKRKDALDLWEVPADKVIEQAMEMLEIVLQSQS